MDISVFTLRFVLYALALSRSRGVDGSVRLASEIRERWPKTLRSTESYRLQPSDSGCMLLPWSAIVTLLFRMLTDHPKDDRFLKDVSVAPENLPRYLADHQPSVKFILHFTNFAWILVALVGAGVIGARFANQCGGDRRQEVGPNYMYYYTKLLTVVEGVIVLAFCAFVLLFAANYGLGVSIGRAPEYFENAMHDLRVYTNLTSTEMKPVVKMQASHRRLSFRGFVAFVRHSRRPIRWTDDKLRSAWDATERERRRADKLLADISTHASAQGKATHEVKTPKGTLTEQGIAKMAQRFAWFDEMTGVWGYYAHPILRPIAVYSIAIAAVVAAVGTAIGHQNHSEEEDPVKRKKISNIAGHALLVAAFIMLVFCVAALLVLKRSTPHAIAGQCYLCDTYRRKEYQQLDFAQDLAWPSKERADIYANMYVGDVLRHCGGEGVSIMYFIKKGKNSREKQVPQQPTKANPQKLGLLLPRRAGFNCETAASVVEKHFLSWETGAVQYHNNPVTTSVKRQKKVLGTNGSGTDVEEVARHYYICSILEWYVTFNVQSLDSDFVAENTLGKAAAMARQYHGPGMCSPVFGIVKTGFSLFCDSFLEYLKSVILTLFLVVLLFFVGMPSLLMLSKYYLIMEPPPEPVQPSPPPTRKPKKKGTTKRPRNVKGGRRNKSGSDILSGKFHSHDAKLGKVGAGTDVVATDSPSKSENSDSKGAKTELNAGTAGKKTKKPSQTDQAKQKQRGIGGLRLLESPDSLLSEESDILSSERSSSFTSIDTELREPAISIKNVKTQSKPEWCIVDTSTMTIPISQLERARDLLTSGITESLAPKKCNVEVLKLPQNSNCLVHGTGLKQAIQPSSAVSGHPAKSSCGPVVVDVRPQQDIPYNPTAEKPQSVVVTSTKAPTDFCAADRREMTEKQSRLPTK